MRLARKSLHFAAVALMSVGLMSPVAQAQTADDLDKQSSDWLAPYRDIDPITTPHPIDEFDELKTSFDADSATSERMMVTNDGSLHGFTVEEAQQAEVLEKQLTSGLGKRLLSTNQCRVFAPSPHLVCGATLERYEKNGGPFSVMGFPLSTEIINPDGVGTRTQFMGGSIYWHPDSGAHFVANAAMRIWERFGWESGVLGYPTTEASSTTIPLAYKQTFSDKDMYYTEVLGGAVWGDIKAKYDSLGGPSHALGIPTTAEQINGDYRYTDFTNGTISWSPERQTRVLYGATRNEWARHGRETGSLGFPLNDEQAILPGLINKVPFATGSIIWSALFGAHYLPSEWELLWDSYKDTLSPLGLPMAWEHYGTEEQSLKLDNGYISLRGDSYGVLSNNPTTLEAGILDGMDRASVTQKNVTLDPGIASLATYSQRDREAKCEAWAEKIRKELSSYEIVSSRRSRTDSFDAGSQVPIRKGHYSWTKDTGFGWMKTCKKHNLGDTRLMAEVIRGGEDFQTTASDQRGAKMRFDVNTCRFARCTSNKQVEIRVTHYPKVAETWHGSASKTGPEDTSPVGLLTGYCFGYDVCPEIVNGPRAIALGPDPLE